MTTFVCCVCLPSW